MLQIPRRLAVLLAVLLVATGCDSSADLPPVVADCTDDEARASASCDDPATPAVERCENVALSAEDLEVGTGQAVDVSRTVSVYYTGRLANGTVFDSVTVSTGAPLRLPLLQFVPGFAFGIGGTEAVPELNVPQIAPMRLGGRRRITIPPNLAYRNARRERDGVEIIPSCSTLIFDVTLVDA